MNVAELFIRRPITTTLIMLAILLFGIIGYRELPVSNLPNVDFPTILVTTSLPGANPDTMASAVATPLERQFSTIAGLDSMTSCVRRLHGLWCQTWKRGWNISPPAEYHLTQLRRGEGAERVPDGASIRA